MNESTDNPFQQWSRRLQASCVRARVVTKDLSESQLNWKASPDSWSIGQCLEHMTVGVEEYLAPLRPALQDAHQRIEADMLEPKHSLMGKQIVKAISPQITRTMNAPKIFAPTSSTVSEQCIERFLSAHKELEDIISSAEGLDTNRIRMSSPVAWFIRINITDAFEILVAHAERHLNQAERILQHESFPK